MNTRLIILIAVLGVVLAGAGFWVMRPNPEAQAIELFTQATAAAEAKQWEQAIALLDQAIALEIKDPKERSVLYLERGLTYFKQKNLEKSLPDLNQTLILDPQSATAAYARATLYSIQKKVDLATKDYQKVLEIEPENALAQQGLGNIYLNQGQCEKALPFLAKSSEKIESRQKYLAHANLAFCYFQTDQLSEAQTQVEKAIALNPQFPNSYFVRAGIAAKKNQCPQAEADAKKSCALGFKPACQATCAKLKK